MPRAIWSGAISFGLVNIPVKVYSAQSPKDVHFNQLHDKDGGRIHMKRVCSVDGEEVPYANIAKGYEVSKDQYVLIGKDELENFAPEKTQSIDILDFVELAQIDPLYYESGYYLVPDKTGARAYALLLAAMRESERVAIAKVVLRTKEYLAALRAVDDAIVMSTMLYGDEVVDPKNIEGLSEVEKQDKSKNKPSEREVKMAQQLIEALAADFDPHKYQDEYREKVLDLIEKKARGERIELQEPAAKPTKAIDLAAALEASLAAAKGGKKARPAEVEAVPKDKGKKEAVKVKAGRGRKKA